MSNISIVDTHASDEVNDDPISTERNESIDQPKKEPEDQPPAAQQHENTLTWSRTKTSKRPLCTRCQRPTPGACICAALPAEPIELSKSRILVLQHPHETKRKNRSVPLLQLALSKDSMDVAVGRRLGDQLSFQSIIQDESQPLLLLYPGPDAIPLEEAMELLKPLPGDKLNILVLDGTWKYAKEMDRASSYPDRIQRIQLKPSSFANFRPGRFDIRTPPTPDHLSTAECIAWVVSRIEEDPALYERLLEPLDYMVAKWKSYDKKKRPVEDDAEQGESKQKKQHVKIE